jgi:hypothetical protein
MADDRRKSPRFKLEEPMAAKVRTYVSGQVLDVSISGLRMRVRKPLGPGTGYVMRLAFPERDFEVTGIVKRCSLSGFDTDENGDRVRTYDVAMEFDRPAPDLMGRFRPGDALPIRVDANDR